MSRAVSRAPAVVAQGLYLVIALAALMFSIGNAMAPIAAWLASIFMLRFVRRSRATGVVVGAVGMALVHVVAWRGVLPFSGALYYGATAAVGVVMFLPFLCDRLLAPRLGGAARTLVLPSAWVVVEFAFSRAGFGTWGLVGYSQYGELPLLQILAVTGMAGLTFLIGWVAAVVNGLWESQGRDLGARRMAMASATVLAAVLVVGGLRLTVKTHGAQTVRAAGVTVDNMAVFKDTWGPLTYGKPLTAEQAAAAADKARGLQQTLLDRSREEAERGAKIIVWSEGNALVFKADEADFIRQGQSLAAEQKVYLFMALAAMAPGERRVENTVVVIDPQGVVRGRYLKSHPTPGEMSVPGDGRVGVLQTPYGKLAWAICYDFDYPELIRQAGRAGADILIDPSWEHKGMDPLHTQMATFRAIENGAALFRPVNGGLGMAVDDRGRVLATTPAFVAPAVGNTLLADLPTRGSRTLYPWIGDAPAWAALGLLLVLGAGGLLRPGRRRD